MRRYHIAICDPQGWREFEIALDGAAAVELDRTQACISFLRERLRDDRFAGHVMIMEPLA